jgi:hypothetical protein
MLMTPLFPGWGQLYTDNSWRAALAFGAETFYWSHMLMNERRALRLAKQQAFLSPDATVLRNAFAAGVHNYHEYVRDFAWWSLGSLLIIVLDAYVDAQLYDFDEDPVPVPPLTEPSPPPLSLAAPVEPPPGLVLFCWQTAF